MSIKNKLLPGIHKSIPPSGFTNSSITIMEESLTGTSTTSTPTSTSTNQQVVMPSTQQQLPQQEGSDVMGDQDNVEEESSL